MKLEGEKRGAKMRISKVWGLNCKHPIIDSDHKKMIGDCMYSIGSKWKITDENFSRKTQWNKDSRPGTNLHNFDSRRWRDQKS